jgi:hypothetical protein
MRKLSGASGCTGHTLFRTSLLGPSRFSAAHFSSGRVFAARDLSFIVALAIFWLVSSGMAYLAIRNRRVQPHKEWMIRSYVLTFFFVNARLWPELPLIRTLGTPMERSVISTWLAWVLPLFIAEVLIQWKNVERSEAVRRASSRSLEPR